jgi:hypothetical protein
MQVQVAQCSEPTDSLREVRQSVVRQVKDPQAVQLSDRCRSQLNRLPYR